MSFARTTDATRPVIAFLAALPLTGLVLAAVYASVGLIG